QHLALDVNEQGCDVDELAGHIDVRGLQLVYIAQELGRNAGDGNVVDVDVLLANQVEQEVEWAVVNLGDDDGERGQIGFVVAGFKLDEWLGRGGRRRSGLIGRWVLRGGAGNGCGFLGWPRCNRNGWRLDTRFDRNDGVRRNLMGWFGCLLRDWLSQVHGHGGGLGGNFCGLLGWLLRGRWSFDP